MKPRIVTHPIDRTLWEVRLPCPYSDGETVVFVGTLFKCIAWQPRT